MRYEEKTHRLRHAYLRARCAGSPAEICNISGEICRITG
jgi:hypothetical protein